MNAAEEIAESVPVAEEFLVVIGALVGLGVIRQVLLAEGLPFGVVTGDPRDYDIDFHCNNYSVIV